MKAILIVVATLVFLRTFCNFYVPDDDPLIRSDDADATIAQFNVFLAQHGKHYQSTTEY